MGINSNWVTLAAPWRLLVPTQSEPVSPPPITMTCLPSAAQLALDLVARVHAVLLGQELHREVDAIEVAAGHGQVARDCSAPPVSSTASNSFAVLPA